VSTKIDIAYINLCLPNHIMNFRTVSTRLPVDEFTLVSDYCTRAGISPSALIRNLLFEEINMMSPANVAGQNIIEYDRKKDSFNWKIELDSGEKVSVLKNISPEYLKALQHSISDAMTSRDELQDKKNKDSVPVPTKLLRGRK
jgi:hypothetical protein